MIKRRNRLKELLINGIREGVYPGAALIAAKDGQVFFSDKAGNRLKAHEPLPIKRDTIFDLASLTKPLATTLALMKLVDDGIISLDQTLMSLLSKTLPPEKRALTPRLILCHSAGFVDWKPFYLKLGRFKIEKRKELLRDWIMDIPLIHEPGRSTVYSDLGFMVLEWVIEESAGMPLNRFLDQNFYGPLGLERTFLHNGDEPMRFMEDQFAATEDCPWRKKILQGNVHDENAYALGGFSGHSGLFGIAEEVYTLINLLREHFLGQRGDYLNQDTVRTFFTRQCISDSCTWALGWDTPSPKDSSAGKYFSDKSVGHLGYTGTSMWMDPENDVIAVFLTNRVHPTRKNEKIRAFRPILHDLIMDEAGVV